MTMTISEEWTGDMEEGGDSNTIKSHVGSKGRAELKKNCSGNWKGQVQMEVVI